MGFAIGSSFSHSLVKNETVGQLQDSYSSMMTLFPELNVAGIWLSISGAARRLFLKLNGDSSEQDTHIYSFHGLHAATFTPSVA